MEGYLTNIIGAIAVFLVGTAIKMANSWLKENTDFKISQELKGDILDGVRWGKRKAREELGEAMDQVSFDNKAIQKAYDYVRNNFPKRLKQAGVTEDALVSMIEAAMEE